MDLSLEQQKCSHTGRLILESMWWYRVFVARFDYIMYGILAMHFGIIHYEHHLHYDANMSVTMLNIGQ